MLRVACAKAKANGPDGEWDAERLRDAVALATARACCESLPDYCDRARSELQRLRGMAVSRRGEGSCVCARVQIGSNGEATLDRRRERRWRARMRQRGGRPLGNDVGCRQQRLYELEGKNLGRAAVYAGEVEAGLAQLQVRVVKPDGVLDVSTRYYSGRPGTKMELGGRPRARAERLDVVVDSSTLCNHGRALVWNESVERPRSASSGERASVGLSRTAGSGVFKSPMAHAARQERPLSLEAAAQLWLPFAVGAQRSEIYRCLWARCQLQSSCRFTQGRCCSCFCTCA